jgi:hypothetical protein
MISNGNLPIIHRKIQMISDADYPIFINQKTTLDGNLTMIEFFYQEQQDY